MASKTTLISELKRAVRQVSPDVVFESCSSWTNRLSEGDSFLKNLVRTNEN